MSKKLDEPKWVVVEFREYNEDLERTEVFYNAVPTSWISFGHQNIVNWSSSINASKEIMLGNPPKEPTKPYKCKILSKEFGNFQEANKEELRIFNSKRSKMDLTTEEDSHSSEEEQFTIKGSDFNKEAEQLINAAHPKLSTSNDTQKNDESAKLSENDEAFGYQDSVFSDFAFPSEPPINCDTLLADVTKAFGGDDSRTSSKLAETVSAKPAEVVVTEGMLLTGSEINNLTKSIKDNKDLIDLVYQLALDNNGLLQKMFKLKKNSNPLTKKNSLEIITSYGLTFPVNSSEGLTKLRSVFTEEGTNIKKALESYLLQVTIENSPVKKNCNLVINALLDFSFMSSNYTWAYGGPGKSAFSQTNKEIVSGVAEIIQIRFPNTSAAEVEIEFKKWFKYVGQESKRQEAKRQEAKRQEAKRQEAKRQEDKRQEAKCQAAGNPTEG